MNGLNDNIDNDDLPMEDTEIVNALTRLAHSLKGLDDSISAPQLSHYRTPSDAVAHSYKLLEQGSSLVHGTSTKYTLMGKIDRNQQNQIAKDLLKGCQLVATGCLVLHQDNTGCSRSVRHSTKRACRSIIQAVLQLVQSFVDETALDGQHDGDQGHGDDGNKERSKKTNNVGAQKTGAVWESCDYVLQKKLPVGNRNAMRRDLFTYVKECNETMHEFQELVDAGPALREEGGEENEESGDSLQTKKVVDDVDDDDAGWEAFLCGQDDEQYTAEELPVAEACIGIVKTSRGSLNALLKACEEIGQLIVTTEDVDGGNNNASTTNNNSSLQLLSDQDRGRLRWISNAHDLGRLVGEGMTDLGATLYPPLRYDTMQIQIDKQSNAIENLLMYVLDPAAPSSSAITHASEKGEGGGTVAAATATTATEEEETDAVIVFDHQFSDEVTEIASKVLAAVRKRKEEAEAAMKAVTS